MVTIPQKELRNNVGDVLRRAEAGEEFTVTVTGRPVARLGPVRPRQWVEVRRCSESGKTPAPESLDSDLANLAADVSDVFAGDAWLSSIPPC